MRTSWPAVVLAGTVLALTACGGDDKPSGYPSEVRQNFMRACNLNSSGDEKACKCTLQKLEDTVSYEDFKRADAEIQGGGQASGETGAKIKAATSACR